MAWKKQLGYDEIHRVPNDNWLMEMPTDNWLMEMSTDNWFMAMNYWPFESYSLPAHLLHENVKIHIYMETILPGVLYVCETWSVI